LILFAIVGILIFIIWGCATDLYRFGNHRFQKRNLYIAALAAFFSICIFGYMEPKSPLLIMMAFGFSAPIALLFGYFLIRWFLKRQADDKLILPKSFHKKNLISSFCILVLCNIFFRTHWGEILLKLQWVCLSMCLGWLFSSLYFIWYIAKVEKKLGRFIFEEIKNT
jgi:hypothetical protein